MDLTDDERDHWEASDGYTQEVFQKLSDARAALRAAEDSCVKIVGYDIRYLRCDVCSARSNDINGPVLHMPRCPFTRSALATPAPVAVPTDDVGRCAICAWPLAKDGLVSQGCVRGNCSFRGEPPIRPEQRYAPARAEIEACAGCAKVSRHPGEGYACLAHPAAAAKACTSFSPPEFSGRWRDWHRGHGCDRDDGKPRTAKGAAEIASIGAKT